MSYRVVFLTFLAAVISLAASARRVPIEKIDQLRSGDTLFFDKTEYHFWAHSAQKDSLYLSNTTDVLPKNLAIVLRGLSDVVIDGGGAMLTMHGQIQPLTLIDCRGIKVKNLHIDWQYPLTAQGRVEQVTDDGFAVAIDELQFPYYIENNRLIFSAEGWKSGIFSIMEFMPYDSMGVARIAPSTGDATSWGAAGYAVEEIEPGLIFFKADTSKYRPALGNYVVLRHNERAHAGVFVERCADVEFDNLWVYHTGGLGVLCQFSENLKFNNSGVVPNADKGRYLSGHDDGFHLMGCRGDILIENCRWQGLMDDPINIHGTAVRIVGIKDRRTIVCRFMQPQSVGMEWGQSDNGVAFLESKTLRTLGESKIESYTKLSTTDFQVTLMSDIPQGLSEGDALENLYWIPSSVVIRDNVFGGNRARGLLVSVSGRVLIENNDFYSSGAAILIAGDANQWYETGAVRDVVIRGNRFFECNTSSYQFCDAVISICPEIPQADPQYPFHSGIEVVDNTFYSPRALTNRDLIYIYSAKQVVFQNNRIEQTL